MISHQGLEMGEKLQNDIVVSINPSMKQNTNFQEVFFISFCNFIFRAAGESDTMAESSG